MDREDFGSGTSSKSTKLVHGGVRYLEKAVFNLDYGQLKLVFEALHERKRMLDNAPLCTGGTRASAACDIHCMDTPRQHALTQASQRCQGLRDVSCDIYAACFREATILLLHPG